MTTGTGNGKYSYDDARTLNQYAQKATSATTTAVQTINKSYSGMTSVRVMYVNQAISYIQNSMTCLEYSLQILESHVPLEYSSGDYATVTDVVRESYELLDQVDELVATEANYQEVRDQVLDALMTAGSLNLKFQSATVELLDAFT